MTWTIKSEADEAILKELYQQTDRGAAIIAAAYLEDRLVDAIKARTNSDDKIESHLYKGSGAFASFSVKIDLGLLLGIFDPKSHRIFHTIKDIRNQFAHNPKPTKFESQKIRDLCKNIDVDGVAELMIANPDGAKLPIKIELIPDGTPKTAFLNAVKLLIFLLEMEIKIAGDRKPAPPLLPPLSKRPVSVGKT